MIELVVVGSILLYSAIAGVTSRVHSDAVEDEVGRVLISLIWPVTLPWAVGHRLTGRVASAFATRRRRPRLPAARVESE